MRSWYNKNKKILLISTIIILILILVILEVFLYKNDKDKNENLNNYRYGEALEELPGSKKYTNNKLKASHCLDNICIENLVFHYLDNSGRIDYIVRNKSNKKRRGYLKIVFKDQSLIIIYDVEAKGIIQTSSRYEGFDIKNKKDYTLKKLSKEEEEKIIKK